jgi:hypothetical protein
MNVRLLFVGVAAFGVLAPAMATAQRLANPESASAAAPAPTEALPWQLSKKFPINETDPEASVPNKKQRDRNPMEYGYLIQDLLEGAEMARKNGDYYTVVAYYRAIVKAVPERAKSWSKLCESYAIVNDHARAAKTCSTALSLPGVELQDYMRYVHETLLLRGKPSPETAAKLRDVLDHLDKQPNILLATSQLRCEVGVALSDAKMLETCTAVLTQLEPSSVKTVVYQWTLAVMRGQTEAAGRLLQRAKALKLPEENIERMQAVTGAGSGRRYVWTGLGAAFFLLAAGGALLVARRRRSSTLTPAAR